MGEGRLRFTKPRILLVEGWDDYGFYYAMLRHLGLLPPERGEGDIQVAAGESKRGLVRLLRGLHVITGFDELVRVCGVIGDSNDDPNAAFHSMNDAISAAGGLDKISSLGEWTGGTPKMGVMLQPGRSRRGHLQTMIQQALDGGHDPAIPCVDSFMSCVEAAIAPPRDPAKAYVQAFLASRADAGLSVGIAADKGYLALDSPAYKEVREFLQSMPT